MGWGCGSSGRVLGKQSSKSKGTVWKQLGTLGYSVNLGILKTNRFINKGCLVYIEGPTNYLVSSIYLVSFA
jgi:hypothetical protein